MLGAFLLVGCLLFVRLGGWKGWRCVVSCIFGGLRASLRDGACYVEFSEPFAEKLFVWSLFPRACFGLRSWLGRIFGRVFAAYWRRLAAEAFGFRYFRFRSIFAGGFGFQLRHA